MSSAIKPTHVAPADQPTSVHQIAERLFAAYTVDDGAVHLAGCLLDDRIFVRLAFRAARQSIEVYLDCNGQEVDDELVQALGMTRTIQLSTPSEPIDPAISQLLECGSRLLDQRSAGSAESGRLSAEIVWCKYAEGKLRFTVGDQAADIPFSDWARPLKPPPFVCPYSGQSTFHLAATDDGRIAAADQIEVCAETGRRLLSSELVTCAVTGRRVAAELTLTCPVSGQRLLRSKLVRCGTCGEEISPAVLKRHQCAACRKLRSVNKSDPRVAQLLHEYPQLDHWGKWRLSETATVYVLLASRWLKRLLVVADKDTLELRLLATARRFFPGWTVLEPVQRDYLLRK